MKKVHVFLLLNVVFCLLQNPASAGMSDHLKGLYGKLQTVSKYKAHLAYASFDAIANEEDIFQRKEKLYRVGEDFDDIYHYSNMSDFKQLQAEIALWKKVLIYEEPMNKQVVGNILRILTQEAHEAHRHEELR